MKAAPLADAWVRAHGTYVYVYASGFIEFVDAQLLGILYSYGVSQRTQPALGTDMYYISLTLLAQHNNY